MKSVDTIHATEQTIFEPAQQPDGERNQTYTVGDFLRQFGAVIAVCLGLAILAQVVVFMVGG